MEVTVAVGTTICSSQSHHNITSNLTEDEILQAWQGWGLLGWLDGSAGIWVLKSRLLIASSDNTTYALPAPKL